MALTLEAEQKLEDVGLIAFFLENETQWVAVLQDCHDYVRKMFKHGAMIRHDDVAKFLRPSMEVDDGLQDELSKRRLTQKYWIGHFTDLVIDRCWDQIRR